MAELLAEVEGGKLLLPGDSAWSIIQHGLDADPDKSAVVSLHQHPDHLGQLVGPGPTPNKCLTWSYAQLQRAAARVGSVLDKLDVPPGSTLVTFITNRAECTLMMWIATLKCYTFAALDPGALGPTGKDELEFYLSRLLPTVVVVEAEAEAATIDGLRDVNQDLFLGLSLDPLGKPRQDWISVADIARMPFTDQQSTAKPSADHLDRVASMIYTSGTSSGSPKLCLKTVKNTLAGAAANSGLGAPPPLVAIVHTPFFGGFAQALSFTIWYDGGTVVIPHPGFSLASSLEATETFQGELIGFMASKTHLLLQHPEYSREKVRSMKCVFLSGEVVTSETLKETQEVFPNAAIFPAHGMSEGVGMFGWPSKLPDPVPVFGHVASSGLVLPGTKAKIVDQEGRIVKRLETGELHLSSDCLIDEYLKSSLNSEFFYEEGGRKWLKTGDIAALDEAGYIYLLGRCKDIITVRENQVIPVYLESCIHKHIGIQVQVLGVPHPTHGVSLYVIIWKLPKDITPADVMELSVKYLGPNYALDGVILLEQLGKATWPLKVTGKISRAELQRAATEYLAVISVEA